MTRYLYANNATTTLAQSVSATATIINVASGDGDLFPSPATGEAFAITFVDAATGLQNEIAYCTSRSGDALTVVRGQENKNAKAWSAGDTVANYITAGVIESWLQESDLSGYATESWAENLFATIAQLETEQTDRTEGDADIVAMLSSYLPLAGGTMTGDINISGHNLTNNGGSRIYMNPDGHIQVFDNSNALRFEIGMSDGNAPFVNVPDGVLFEAPYNCVLGGGTLGGEVVVPVATADNQAVQFSQLVTEQTDRTNEDAILAAGLSTSVQQQIDDNTYGIKTFGYNHVAGTLGAFDTNGSSWLIQLAGDYATNTSLANEVTTRTNEVADLQSGKANLTGGNAFTGVQTVQGLNAGTTNVYGGEIRSSFQDTNGFSHFEAYINTSGVRQIALGNYDGANYTTWFLDNSTSRMIMPDGAVSAVTSELPTAGTITGGTYTKTPMNDGTGRSILRLHYSVSSPPGEGSITFPATFSQLPNVSLSTTDDSGNSYSVIANVRSNTITTTGFTLFAAWYAGEESGISGSSTITVTAEGIVS